MTTTSDLTSRLVGTWRCVGGRATDRHGETTLVLDGGLLTYTAEGLVHVVVSCDPERSRAEALAGTGTCIAYCGTFTVTARPPVVHHHLTHSTQPEWVGRCLPRGIELSDDGRRLRLHVDLDHQASRTHDWRGGGAVVEWSRTHAEATPPRPR